MKKVINSKNYRYKNQYFQNQSKNIETIITFQMIITVRKKIYDLRIELLCFNFFF